MPLKSSNQKRKKRFQNQGGILTIDFLFSTIVVFAISMVFAVMSITLMFSSVAQYVLFSSARAKASAHISEDEQLQMADDKFAELVQDKLKQFFVDNEWFELRKINFHVDDVEDASTNPIRGRKFYGVSALYVSKILDFRVPMIGNTTDGLGDDEFSATMSAFIYREPSTQECLNFNREKWRVLSSQFPELNSGAFSLNTGASYGEEADNGC